MSGVQMMLLGVGGYPPPVQLQGGQVYAYSTNGTATCGFSLTSGNLSCYASWTGNGGRSLGIPSQTVPAIGAYVRATLTSGSIDSGPIGSWVAVSTEPVWQNSRTFSTSGGKVGYVTLDFAPYPNGPVVATGQFSAWAHNPIP